MLLNLTRSYEILRAYSAAGNIYLDAYWVYVESSYSQGQAVVEVEQMPQHGSRGMLLSRGRDHIPQQVTESRVVYSPWYKPQLLERMSKHRWLLTAGLLLFITKLRGLGISLKIWEREREKYVIKLEQINFYFFQ